MHNGLSQRQRQILDFIKQQVVSKGYPPSVREIGQAVGLRSSSTVHGYLSRLEQKGLIRRDPTKPRAIELLNSDALSRPAVENVPVVGQVTAGLPILAIENVESFFPLPQDMVRGQEVFMLNVRGDSMVGAGILDGDQVIVRRQDTAQNGDIVVALLGDEATVKRFFRESSRVRLLAENPVYAPIVAREITILGKVIGLFRRLTP